MPFLFTKTMAERALQIENEINEDPLAIDEAKAKAVQEAQEAYNFFCRQNGGLAYFASFLPGCEAFKARMVLSETVDAYSKSLIDNLARDKDDDESFHKFLKRTERSLALRGPILGAILSLPFKVLWDTSEEHIHKYDKNRKHAWLAIASTAPIITDVAENDKIANLIHTLCNPVRLVDQALRFLHLTVNRLIEIGGNEGRAGPGRKFAKGVVAALFTVVALPVKLVSAIADIPYQVVKNGIYEPLKFVVTAVKKNDNKLDGTIIENEEASKVENWVLKAGKKLTTSGLVLQNLNVHLHFMELKGQTVNPATSITPPFQNLGGKNKQKFFSSERTEVQMVKELAKVARGTYTDEDARNAAANQVIGRYRRSSVSGSGSN